MMVTVSIIGIAADSHRVKLQREDNSDTDFINASYMGGYHISKQYIAAQGMFICYIV